MTLLADILPVVALALAGYLSAWRGWLHSDESAVLSKFTFTLAIPCLLFISLATAEIPAGTGGGLLVAYYTPVLLIYLLAAWLGWRLFACNAPQRSVLAMGAAYSNTTVIGIPLVVQTLGRDALVPLFLLIAVQNLFLFTAGTLVAEFGQGGRHSLRSELWNLGRQLLGSPITASLIAGVLYNLSGLALYAPVANTLGLIADAAIPLALFVLGTSLQRFRIQGAIAPALLMSVLKTVALPVLVWVFCFRLFALEPLWAHTALLASTLPTGISAYVFAVRYDTGHAMVAAGSLMTAVFSIVPVLIVLWLITGQNAQ